MLPSWFITLIRCRPVVDDGGAPTRRPVARPGPARPEDHREKRADDPDDEQDVAKSGENVLGGITGYRLVSVNLH
jgi:hypothetical protein